MILNKGLFPARLATAFLQLLDRLCTSLEGRDRLSASRYFGDRETLCLYWPLGTVVITGPKVLDFYAGFCAQRATCLKADGKDITGLKLILIDDSNARKEAGPLQS